VTEVIPNVLSGWTVKSRKVNESQMKTGKIQTRRMFTCVLENELLSTGDSIQKHFVSFLTSNHFVFVWCGLGIRCIGSFAEITSTNWKGLLESNVCVCVNSIIS